VIPEDLRYTAEHEWVSGDGSGPVRVGITHYAQDALGEIESTKSVSEIYAPVAGTVVARNASLADEPELVNAEPYAAGWLVEIAPDDPGTIPQLLDAAAYQALTES
jgi:glycine cleavage system H protein